MQLQELTGEHTLDAVDFNTVTITPCYGSTDSCGVMLFRLDGKVYAATEDPDDGYRSCMRELTVSDAPMTNTFEPIRVIGRHRERMDEEYHENDTSDILELVDAVTGLIVITVGTENTNDYYPWYEAKFNPENMAPNAEVV